MAKYVQAGLTAAEALVKVRDLFKSVAVSETELKEAEKLVDLWEEDVYKKFVKDIE